MTKRFQLTVDEQGVVKAQVTPARAFGTSHDWSGYPITTFDGLPAFVLSDRPDEPSIGAGEGTVRAASAALANALAHVIGKPVRNLPLTGGRILRTP